MMDQLANKKKADKPVNGVSGTRDVTAREVRTWATSRKTRGVERNPPPEGEWSGKGSVKGEEERRGRRRPRERGLLLSGLSNAGMKQATPTTSPISRQR